jgi:hypothetical protein
VAFTSIVLLSAVRGSATVTTKLQSCWKVKPYRIAAWNSADACPRWLSYLLRRSDEIAVSRVTHVQNTLRNLMVETVGLGVYTILSVCVSSRTHFPRVREVCNNGWRTVDQSNSGLGAGSQKKLRTDIRYGAMMSFSLAFTWTAARLDASHPPPRALTSSTLVVNL